MNNIENLEWLGCERINNKEGKDFNDKKLDYIKKIGREPEHSIWFDKDEGKVFGLDLNYNIDTSEACMLTNEENFAVDGYHGGPSISSIYEAFFCNIKKESEMFYSYNEQYEKYKDSKILIVAAGPSASDKKWSEHDYDFLWSCSHYYKADFLKDFEMDLVNLGNEVNLQDPELLARLARDKSNIVFDAKVTRNLGSFSNFCTSVENLKEFYHTRYFGKIGTASRMLVFASLLGASEISFAGVDGIAKTEKDGAISNSFEIGKKQKGPWGYNLFKRQYVMLWEYLLFNIGKEIRYHNLGEGHVCNMTTEISRQMF
jgi:hypothetical protein